MNEPKRLKRGLKDISALFQPAFIENRVLPSVPLGLHSLGLLSPEAPEESLFLNACLAARLQELQYDCTLLSIGGKKSKQSGFRNADCFAAPSGAPRNDKTIFCLSLKQFNEICHRGMVPGTIQSGVFLFDFDYSNPLYFEKVLPVLDKWVLLLKPEQESLCEGYKFIKASVPLNRDLEYFVIFNGSALGNKGGFLFEKFSEMVSRRLGLTLQSLGCWEGMVLENLPLPSSADSVEKRAFAGFVHHSEVQP